MTATRIGLIFPRTMRVRTGWIPPFFRGRGAVFWWRFSLTIAAAAFSLLLILQPPPWQVLTDAAGEELSVGRIVFIGTWLGGAGGIAILAFLFTVCPWWACAPDPANRIVAAPRAPVWFWPVVAAAVIAAGSIATPSLGHSLWDDEHESLVWYILGRYVRQAPEGNIKLKEHNWRRTVFAYSTPNNHVFHNILARWSNATWRALAAPKERQFSEVALRLPAFLAGLACVAALALLLKDFGLPGSGALAAWFLALQPWFTQHMALARGYALVMLLTVLVLVFWRRALVSGAWQWWALLAACQFFALWTYPAVVFLLALLNLSLVALILFRPSPVNAPARTLLSRWFSCSCLAGAGLLPLVFPLVPQMKDYMESLGGGMMALPWLANLGSFLVGGAAWDRSSGTGTSYLDMQLVARSCGPAVLHVLYGGAVLVFVMGLVRFFRRGKLEATVAACVVLGPAMHWLYAETKGVILWEWYLVYVVPSVCLFWGVGTAAVGQSVARFTRSSWPGVLASALVVAFYAYAASPVRAWHSAHSRVPYRESTVAARSGVDGARTIVFSTTGAPLAYDPALFYIEEPLDLAILMFQADTQQRPLVANMGQMQNLRERCPEIFALLESKKLFPVVERFPGFMSGGDRFVCRYAAGSAAAFDFSGILDTDEVTYAKSKAGIAPEKFFAGRGKKHIAQGAGGYGPSPGSGKEPHGFRK